jgi:hypothetical protein
LFSWTLLFSYFCFTFFQSSWGLLFLNVFLFLGLPPHLKSSCTKTIPKLWPTSVRRDCPANKTVLPHNGEETVDPDELSATNTKLLNNCFWQMVMCTFCALLSSKFSET